MPARLLAALAVATAGPAWSADPLPGTRPLPGTGAVAADMLDGFHKYLDRELVAATERRSALWKPDFASADAYGKSVGPNRERLRRCLGVIDKRLPPKLEYVGGPDAPSLVAETDAYTVHAVRWAVLPGIDGEGLLLVPKGAITADVVALPDADGSAEEMVGLTGNAPPDAQFARRLAENGCRVIVPVLIDRRDEWSGSARLGKWTNQTHREWVHRMAFEMGRTLPGFEVQKVLAAVDWLTADRKGAARPVGVAGRGEGGTIGLWAAACDERVTAVAVSGVFGEPGRPHELPFDRHLWKYHAEFGDADVLRLVYPRPAVLELIGFTAADPPPARPGRSGAAPGRFTTASLATAVAETGRVLSPLAGGTAFPRLPISVVGGAFVASDPTTLPSRQTVGPVMGDTLRVFLARLAGVADAKDFPTKPPGPSPADRRGGFDPVARQRRQFEQLASYVHLLWRQSDAVRKTAFAVCDATSPAAWEKSCDPLRETFDAGFLGRLPAPTVPLTPRSRRVYDEPTWTGYEVTIDVFPDVFASGILLLPKGIKPGERRPAVVCQHGLNGTPRMLIDGEEKRVTYNRVARKLVERGYVVFAPQGPWISEDRFRTVNRKAYPLGLSLFSFVVRQHGRILDWLETLPQVDPKRIGFYGLSYGGKTALRVGAVERRYAAVVCSGDFNEWVGKMVSTDLPASYMFTREYEMYEWDAGHTFSHAEMAALIAPRPFMVERGHDDPVGTDEMVAGEYAKVRYLYANRLKIADRTAIEFFPGGHRINADGTFTFLAMHLGR